VTKVERENYRLQDISAVARFASYGGPAEALATAGSYWLFDIVWGDLRTHADIWRGRRRIPGNKFQSTVARARDGG
jgi:hypothetical protein